MDYKNFTDADKALNMIIDKTGDLGGGNSLSEKSQRLLDLPCECCNDGEIINAQQVKIDRLGVLLANVLKALEEQSGESVMGTDLEDKIGITQEEYDEITGNEHRDTDINRKYDSVRFRYSVVIECVKSGKEYYDEYEPDSLRWEDIIAKYNLEREKLIKEIKDDFPGGEQLEWLMNDYQPITMFKCKNGNWYEIYVRASEK